VASSANPRNGAVTADFRVFSAEALSGAGLSVGEKTSAFGAELDWHPTAIGTPDALKVAGQQVSLEGEGDELVVAGFSAGTATSGTATVHYQDGTSQQVQLSLPLWTDASADAADTVLLGSAGSYLQRTKPYLGGSISTVTAPASVFAQRIPLSGKPVSSVTLPAGSPVTGEGLSLFAMKLAGSAVPTSTSVVTECRGPNAWVHVTVANEADTPITVAVDTVLGDDLKVRLNPGKDTRSSFKIHDALTDGAVTVVASTADGARTTAVVPYTGIGCR
jgi:hypothetical protein